MQREQEKIIHYLTKLKLNLPNDILAKIEKEKHQKGTYLVKAGQPVSKIWFLESGIAHLFYQKGSQKVTETFAFPNEIFSVYTSLIRKSPSILSIQLLTNAVVWSMEWDYFQQISKSVPVTIDIERLLIACWIYNSMERSLNRFFTVEEQYLFLIKRQPKLIEQIPSVYIANYLGTTPETISRVRSKIKDGVDLPDVSPFEYIFIKRKK
ncbi:Crp/Fnr family transcriptional regulator [Maribellus maritimus]|uniref:Crp/Fnr family transcriptional regulator n=1 Tax=Maribellus maritimus TaxID=2870838 RepID=UPI001EECC3F6|nr:Crp/Fnr family transcriptional regulator [Maribellus maritimus]MCG6186877.1 Crp/Fnr family transcriptional regulator [Maribellus maritimus]